MIKDPKHNGDSPQRNGRQRTTLPMVTKKAALAELIGNPFDTDGIREKCDRVGVAHTTYYRWLHSDPEFAASIRRSTDRHIAAIDAKAMQSLQSLLSSGDRKTIVGAIRTALQSSGRISSGVHVSANATATTEVRNSEFRGVLEDQLQKRLDVISSN